MKFYLISDNVDTKVGMRLAGIDGVLIHGREEAEAALAAAMAMEDVAVVLVTPQIMALCAPLILDLKLKCSRPLLTEIPDRHGGGGRDTITRYVQQAVGIKID